MPVPLPTVPLPPSVPSLFGATTIAADNQVFDSLESIWYFPKYQDAPDFTPANTIPIPNVLWRAQGLIANDWLQVNDKNFSIWANDMPALVGPINPDTNLPYWTSPFVPCKDDLLMEPDGTIWQVVRVDFFDFVTRYRLTCQKFLQS